MGETSVHQQVQQIVRRVIDGIVSSGTTGLINAGAVGRMAYEAACSEGAEVPIVVEWTSVEEFKQIARRELRGKFEHDSDENDVYQNDMFAGHLQDYYPVRVVGEEPFYKRRELLTDDEIDQNLRSLKKQADARLQHYDALAAYKLQRKAAA